MDWTACQVGIVLDQTQLELAVIPGRVDSLICQYPQGLQSWWRESG